MGLESRIPLRMLAPASLVLFAVVLLIVIVASLGGGDSGSGGTSTSSSRSGQTRSERTQSDSARFAGRHFYVVRSGDTLAQIAERTGIPVDRLISLNPSVDPQGLVSGQRIKLRE
jgi:LysM repeat protein